MSADLTIDPAKTSLAGLTQLDIARSMGTALNGAQAGTLHDGDRTLPIMFRLAMDERARLGDLSNLQVYSESGSAPVPLAQVARVEYQMRPARIVRYQQFGAIKVACFPTEGKLPSEVLNVALPRIRQVEAQLPPGFRIEIAGEYVDRTLKWREVLDSVDPDMQFVLRQLYRGFSVQEIAGEAGVTPNTLFQRLGRMRKQLKKPRRLY